MALVSLSVLSANPLHFEESIAPLLPLVDRIHYDVMDGHLVDNIALGFPLLEQWKSPLPIDAHLMISNPERFLERFAKYTDGIYIHWEAVAEHLVPHLEKVRNLGNKAGITLNPATPAEVLFPYLDSLTHVLIMSVVPGFGGQTCMTETFDKIAILKQKKPELIITVDGGITNETAPLARAKGADILVSGSYLFKSSDMPKPWGWCGGRKVKFQKQRLHPRNN